METKEHKVKILTEHFIDVVAGEKRAEIRKNDRNYKNGDILVLEEFDGTKLTGASHRAIITHMVNGPQFGIEDGFAMLSIRDEI